MTSSDSFRKVAIHGAPRSGTSWLGEILNSSPATVYRYQPLFSYAHKDFLDERSGRADIEEFFRRIAHCRDAFTNQTERRNSGELPRFAKSAMTHVVYKEVRYHHILENMMQQMDDTLLVAIIRSPLAVIDSWLRAPREFRADLGWTELEEWRFAEKKNAGRPEEFNGYEKWKVATRIFMDLRDAYPDRVYLLHYSPLLTDPLTETGKLFDFLDLAVTGATLDFLKRSRSVDDPSAYSVFRTRPTDDAWQEGLNPAISGQIVEDIRGTSLEAFLGQEPVCRPARAAGGTPHGSASTRG
jgi:hypothetical protein